MCDNGIVGRLCDSGWKAQMFPGLHGESREVKRQCYLGILWFNETETLIYRRKAQHSA